MFHLVVVDMGVTQPLTSELGDVRSRAEGGSFATDYQYPDVRVTVDLGNQGGNRCIHGHPHGVTSGRVVQYEAGHSVVGRRCSFEADPTPRRHEDPDGSGYTAECAAST